MKTFKVLLLIIMATMFIKCTSKEEVSEDKQILMLSTYVADNLEYSFYSDECTFIDSAVTRADVVHQIFTEFKDRPAFNADRYIELIKKEIHNYNVNETSKLLLAIVTLALFIGMIGVSLLRIYNKNTNLTIEFPTAVICMSFFLFLGMWMHMKSIEEINKNSQLEEYKHQIEQRALEEYFLNSS